MATNRRTVTVDGHRLSLTHPDKVLYPATGTTKAEVIDYFQQIAPVLVPQLTGRPVTRKRWPDGVGTEKNPGTPFFRKNLENSAPPWVARLAQQHSDHVNVFPMVTGAAELAWFGQIAALELHVPQWRFTDTPVSATAENQKETGKGEELEPSALANPDRLVLDLDPGPKVGLTECARVAFWCRDILADMGLETVPVTSGSKGIHLYARLDGSYTSEQVSDVAGELARSLQVDEPDSVISTMKKADRTGKVFIDWSQNSQSKTTISPYSLRGRSRPTVAAPRTWQELESPDLGQLDFHEVLERVAEGTDPMADFGAETAEAKVGDRLSTYRSKRDRSKTSEPIPAQSMPRNGTGPNAEPNGEPIFVVQKHHARALHFDTRIEHDGVLASWAVPKGPPLRRGVRRLAVQTEDHPLDYATFEGTIPSGEYGGGEVSIWDTGTAVVEKWDDDEVVAVLHGQPDDGLGGRPRRYVFVRTGSGDSADQWLMQLTRDQPATASRQPHPKPEQDSDGLESQHVPRPMLATAGSPRDVQESGWRFEGKWDGYRVVAAIDDGVTLSSRNGKNLTALFPELTDDDALGGYAPPGTVLDGEVIALNASSRPDFGLVQQRGQLSQARHIKSAATRIPVYYMVFDILRTAKRGDLMESDYRDRRSLLLKTVSESRHVQVPEDLGTDLDEAMTTSSHLQLEGVVAKRSASTYSPGRRSDEWIKIKHDHHQEAVIIGWRTGYGARATTFGSVLLAVPDDGALVYCGRVGTGFSDDELNTLHSRLQTMERKTSPATEVPREDAADAHWVTAKLVAEVKHSGRTRDGRLRQPVWRGLRPDKSRHDVVWES